MSGFDSYAHDYDAALNRGLAVSGEDKEFFARGRVFWLSLCLKELQFVPEVVLDFGCGIGTATPLFYDLLGGKVGPRVRPINRVVGGCSQDQRRLSGRISADRKI
jgi:hypothetical protein